ncbi:hypothetical protein AGMMS50293_27120 [Spirochaetia bacterium]|nr:hypothetical protein AGMMS50293_27120 [Spirochaetia bacterium]
MRTVLLNIELPNLVHTTEFELKTLLASKLYEREELSLVSAKVTGTIGPVCVSIYVICGLLIFIFYIFTTFRTPCFQRTFKGKVFLFLSEHTVR